MRLYWVALWAIAFAVGICHVSGEGTENENRNDEEVYRIMPLEPMNFNTQAGERHTIIIRPFISVVPVQCFLRTLTGTMISLDKDFDYPGFEIVTGSQVDCGLSVSVTENMIGNWTMIARSTILNEPTERRLTFSLNIKDLVESEENDVPEDLSEEDNIVWLPQINRVTRTGQYIDITLNKLEHNELCYFITPSGVVSEETEVPGVKVQESSMFVSCRITIGPMAASLLGNWTLCGKYGDEEKHERCQLVSIAWNNNNNPNTTWQMNEQRAFNHSVSFDQFLRPVVIGSGSTLNCHVITPFGEDLVLSGLEYPFISMQGLNQGTCAVSIGPIEDWMLGSWTVYGQFRSALWFNEVRMPFNMFLYDEENPYDQPYNVTALNPFNRVVNLHTTTTAEVTGTGSTDSCQYIAPNGALYEFQSSVQFPGVTVADVGNAAVCRMSIGPIDRTMLGEWQLIGKFSSNGIFTERRQTFRVIQEDPENPIIEDRIVRNLTELFFDTNIGATHRIVIPRDVFLNPQSCHIRTPLGLQYTIMDGFHIPGVTVLNGSDVECGVSIHVTSEDLVGEWTLMARATMSSDAIERRLPVVVYVEERVAPFPDQIEIQEGDRIYLRLKNPTDHKDTCRLVPPSSSNSTFTIDDLHNEYCGYVVYNVSKTDHGTWHIVYGKRIVYKASILVNVYDRKAFDYYTLKLIKGSRVNQEFGPETAVYCQVQDGRRNFQIERFGKCMMAIERVTEEHSGQWRMLVGLPGTIMLQEFYLKVEVEEPEPRTVLSTEVQREGSDMIVSCTASGEHNVTACKFRHPQGRVLIAAPGVGQDRYSSLHSNTVVESEMQSHECGLRIRNSTKMDEGVWRCAVDTDEDTYFGFPIAYPLNMNEPVPKPVLVADRHLRNAIEGDAVTMSCSVDSRIRYCYFRAPNGTVFSARPGTSNPNIQYIGNGYDAGECGVRMLGLVAADSGNWSCHVGFYQNNDERKRQPIEEQRAFIEIIVKERMTVRHYIHNEYGLVVHARLQFGYGHNLEYCRFVRIDGLGFVSEWEPSGYHIRTNVYNGECLLQMEEYSMLNLSPWTVAMQITGHDEEITMQTRGNLIDSLNTRGGICIQVWIMVILVGVTLLLVGVSLGPQKNRRWTFERASQLRSSFQNSFRKPKQNENA